MAIAFKTRSTAQWLAFLQGQPDIIYEKIQDYAEVRTDPQALANHYIETLSINHIGETSIVGNLMTFSATPASTKGLPPELGADTEATLLELGLTEEQVRSVIEHAESERQAALDQWGA